MERSDVTSDIFKNESKSITAMPYKNKSIQDLINESADEIFQNNIKTTGGFEQSTNSDIDVMSLLVKKDDVKKKESGSGDSPSLASPSPSNTPEGFSPYMSTPEKIDNERIQKDLYNEFFAKRGVLSPLQSADLFNKLIKEGVPDEEAASRAGLVLNEGKIEYNPEVLVLADDAIKFVESETPKAVGRALDQNIAHIKQQIAYVPLDGRPENVRKLKDLRTLLGKQLLLRRDYGLMNEATPEKVVEEFEFLNEVFSPRVYAGPAAAFLSTTPTRPPYTHSPIVEDNMKSFHEFVSALASNDGRFLDAIDETGTIFEAYGVEETKYEHDLLGLTRNLLAASGTLLAKADTDWKDIPRGLFVGLVDRYKSLLTIVDDLQRRDSFKKFHSRLQQVEKGTLSVDDLSERERGFLLTMMNAGDVVTHFQDKVPMSTEVTNMLGGALGFILELSLTAGAVSGVRAAGTSAAKAWLTAGTVGSAPLTTKLAAQAAGAVSAATVQTAVLPSTYISAMERYAQGESVPSALYNGYLDQYADIMASQMFVMPVVAKGVGGKALSSSAQKFWASTNTMYGAATSGKEAMKAFLKEYSEEQLASVFNAARASDGDIGQFFASLPSARQQVAIAWTTGIFAMGGRVANEVDKIGVNRKLRQLGEAISPIRADVDAILKSPDINVEGAMDAINDLLIEHGTLNDMSEGDVKNLAQKTYEYAQQHFIKESWDPAAPNRDNPALVGNKFVPVEQVGEGYETVFENSDYSIKAKEGAKEEVVVFTDKLSKIVDDFVSSRPVSPEDMTFARNTLEQIAERVKDPKIKEYLKSEADNFDQVLEGMRPVSEMNQEINETPRPMWRPNKAPIEVVEGAESQDVYDLFIGGKVEGHGQRTVKDGREIFSAFSPTGRKIGDYDSAEAAMKAFQASFKRRVQKAAAAKAKESRKTSTEKVYDVQVAKKNKGDVKYPRRIVVRPKGQTAGPGIAMITSDISAEHSGYLDINIVEVNESFRGQGIGTDLYHMLMENLPTGFRGIVSKQSSRHNDAEVPRIHQKLAKEYAMDVLPNGDILFTKPSMARGLVKTPTTLKELGASLRKKAAEGKLYSAPLAMQVRREVGDTITAMARKGKIVARQAAAAMKMLGRVDLTNPLTRQQFLDYTQKIFDDADNVKRIDDAKKKIKSVKRFAKNKKKNPSLRALAKQLGALNPVYIPDIDAYNNFMDQVIDAFKDSKVKGDGIVERTPLVISEAMEYANQMVEIHNKLAKEREAERNKEMTGYEDLSAATIRDAADMLDSRLNEAETRQRIKDNVTSMMESAQFTIDEMLKTRVNPITGEEIDVTKKQEKIVRDFMAIDFASMSPENALRAYDALNNFIYNETTHGMEATVLLDRGQKNAVALAKDGVRAKDFWTAYRFVSKALTDAAGKKLASLTLFSENIFRGRAQSARFLDDSGLREFINGVSRVVRAVAVTQDTYYETFNKKRPRGKDFMDVENVVERGMYAYLARHKPGTPEAVQAEFEQKKGVIQHSINLLKKGDEKQKKVAEVYESVFKRFSDVDSVEGLEAGGVVNPINKDAVNFWRNEFSDKTESLQELASGIYNKVLTLEENYLPVNFRRLEAANISSTNLDSEGRLDKSVFNAHTNSMPNREATVLMETVQTPSVPTGMYVDFSFDGNMVRALEGALMDLHTAGHRMQVKGFIESPAFNEIFQDAATRNIMKERIFSYMMDIYRRGRPTAGSELGKKTIAWVQQYAATRGLARSTMAVQQMAPVMINTLMNSKNFNFEALYAKKYHDFINRSGYAIANRGVESRGDMPTQEELWGDNISDIKKVASSITSLSGKYLDWVLVKPDGAVARASWITYYEKYLRDKGVDVSKIDWESENIDSPLKRRAADYAQDMVDRQQNVSDPMLMGEFLKDPSNSAKTLRSVFFLFANFVTNQKMRMQTDIGILASKDATIQDKKAAGWSLAGLITEQMLFHATGASLRYLVEGFANNLAGYEETEKEKEERKKRHIKKTEEYFLLDMLSPLPMIDFATASHMRNIAYTISDMGARDVDEDYIMSDYSSVSAPDMLGAGGMLWEDVANVKQMYEMAFTDSYRTDSAGTSFKRFISDADKFLMKAAFWSYTGYALGLFPTDAKNLSLGIMRTVNKRSLTEAGGRNVRDAELKSVERAKQSPGGTFKPAGGQERPVNVPGR